MRQRHKFSYVNVIDIEYDGLVNDPKATVKSVYQHFGLHLNNEYKASLIEDCTIALSYKSTHKYTIEDYGFTREEITHYLSRSPTEDKAQRNTNEYQYQPDWYQ